MPGIQRTNPGTKQIWDVNENEAGALGSFDPAALEITRDVGEDGLEFGIFVRLNAGKAAKIIAASASVIGCTLISNLADDYENRKYNIDDKAAIGRRGYFWVKFDPANIPVVGGAVIVSTAANLEGYLTSLDDVTTNVVPAGVTIETVLDTTAEVYLEGKGLIPITP